MIATTIMSSISVKPVSLNNVFALKFAIPALWFVLIFSQSSKNQAVFFGFRCYFTKKMSNCSAVPWICSFEPVRGAQSQVRFTVLNEEVRMDFEPEAFLNSYWPVLLQVFSTCLKSSIFFHFSVVFF